MNDLAVLAAGEGKILAVTSTAVSDAGRSGAADAGAERSGAADADAERSGAADADAERSGAADAGAEKNVASDGKAQETAEGSVQTDPFGLGIPIPYYFIGGGVLLAIVIIVTVVILARKKSRRKKSEQFYPGAATDLSESIGAGLSPVLKVGKVHEQGSREEQQDSFGISDTSLIESHGLLAVVADGMGGLSDGGKVSKCAVKEVLDTFLMSNGRVAPKELLATLLRCAVTAVNDMLGPDNLRKSGSTLVMTYINNGCFNFLSVGDSRISLYRSGILMQLNREHTFCDELITRAVNGEMTIREAMSDPKGKGLVSFVGIGRINYIDMPASPISLYPGDKLILMSDGVYNAITNDEIADALSYPVEEAADKIREAVRSKGYSNQDNYTAVIIGYGG